MDELLKDSSDEDEINRPGWPGLEVRAKSPPICGRGRSKSKDRRPSPFAEATEIQRKMETRSQMVVPQPQQQELQQHHQPHRHHETEFKNGLAQVNTVPPLNYNIQPSANASSSEDEAKTGCFNRRSRSRSG